MFLFALSQLQHSTERQECFHRIVHYCAHETPFALPLHIVVCVYACFCERFRCLVGMFGLRIAAALTSPFLTQTCTVLCLAAVETCVASIAIPCALKLQREKSLAICESSRSRQTVIAKLEARFVAYTGLRSSVHGSLRRFL